MNMNDQSWTYIPHHAYICLLFGWVFILRPSSAQAVGPCFEQIGSASNAGPTMSWACASPFSAARMTLPLSGWALVESVATSRAWWFCVSMPGIRIKYWLTQWSASKWLRTTVTTQTFSGHLGNLLSRLPDQSVNICGDRGSLLRQQVGGSNFHPPEKNSLSLEIILPLWGCKIRNVSSTTNLWYKW